MNPIFIYTQIGSLQLANYVRTALASPTLHLGKSNIAITDQTTKADLEAQEADYDGYTAKTLSAWLAAYYDPAGGSSFQSGTQQFDYVHDTGVGNAIYNFWLESASGNFLVVGTFLSPVPMNVNGDSLPLNVILNYGRNG